MVARKMWASRCLPAGTEVSTTYATSLPSGEMTGSETRLMLTMSEGVMVCFWACAGRMMAQRRAAMADVRQVDRARVIEVPLIVGA